jgi:GT2 family glycosyltransferase
MIYILLPVHNRRPVTERFAAALARQTLRDFHLVLIDDGSTDDTAAVVTALLPDRTTVLRGSGDWWWGGSLEQGWLWLTEREPRADDVIFMCNDDVDIPDGFLAGGVDVLARNPDAFVVAMASDPASGKIVETCFTIDYRRCAVSIAGAGDRVDCAPTRGLFIRWADMQKVGGFRPRWLPHYLSDIEWTLRAHRTGLAICRDPGLWLVPQHDKTGLRVLRGFSLRARIKHMFSYRYVGNPLHWGAFVLMCFPVRYWPPALWRIAVWTAGGVAGR